MFKLSSTNSLVELKERTSVLSFLSYLVGLKQKRIAMKREEMIEHYKEFLRKESLSPEEAMLEFGGALLYYGLREETDDMDMGLPQEIYDRIVKQRKLKRVMIEGGISTELAKWDDVIDIHPSGVEGNVVVSEGVGIASPQKVLEGKLKLNRPKDQADIKKLKALLRYIKK